MKKAVCFCQNTYKDLFIQLKTVEKAHFVSVFRKKVYILSYKNWSLKTANFKDTGMHRVAVLFLTFKIISYPFEAMAEISSQTL